MKRAQYSCLSWVGVTTTGLFHLAAQTPGQTPLPTTSNPVASAQDIHDIRGPLPIATMDSFYLWLLAGVLLILILSAAWMIYRRSRNRSKLLYELALDRLDKARVLMKPETVREFSIEVSEVVRSYIEQRFSVRAAHQTTEEFLHDLMQPSDALLNQHQELLGAFLNHCDLAKFARWLLSKEDMEGMYQSALTFILESGKPELSSVKIKSEISPKPAQLKSAQA